MLNTSQLHPTKCNCWQLCLGKGFLCCLSCWVSWIASLTFRPCYPLKCLCGIWISDEVFPFFPPFFPPTFVPNMASLHFYESVCIWMLLKVNVHLCSFVMQRCAKSIIMYWPSYLGLLYLWGTNFKLFLKRIMGVGDSALMNTSWQWILIIRWGVE